MRRPSFRQRLQYRFDAFMSRGTSAMLLGLLAFTTLIIVIVALFVAATSSAPDGESILKLTWLGLMHTMDAGALGGDSGGSFFLFMMLAVTVSGMFVFGALIGILNTGLEGRLSELRKGRSLVLENDHTLILGWQPQIFNVIAELVRANESRRSGATIVVLADQDKVEMEDAIRERIPDPKNTRVICRSGSPVDLTELEIASPHTARAIIVLPEGSNPDTNVIKSVLAITSNPNRTDTPYRIVAQIEDAKNVDVVRMLGADDVVLPILADSLIARVAAQTSRQSGLSIVYTEIMGFDGDEFYIQHEPGLSGTSFGEALHAYETCTVIGLRTGDGTIVLNPPKDTHIESSHQVILLAEDDDTVVMSRGLPPTPDESLIVMSETTRSRQPESALILGWNPSGPTIIRELDHYVAPGSRVTVVSNVDGVDEQIRREAGVLTQQKVTVLQGDIRHRDLLESLGAKDYEHVIVLAYKDLGPQEADAITLVTLLHLRDIAERDDTPFSIVSEMLDLRNRELAEATKVDDFIVSEHLVGLMMAQLSENAELEGVFDDLFDAEGSEIYLKPMSDYVVTGTPVDFYTVTEAASRRGETAIGYRLMSESRDAGRSYGVHTNPKKSAKVVFDPEDKIIVIAEE